MSKAVICPNCGGAKTAKGKVDQWRYLNAFDFVPMAPRSCGDCGHDWEPPAPQWVLVLLMLLGFLVLGLMGVAFAYGGNNVVRKIILGVMGVVLIVGCIGRLRNRAPTTITQGRQPPAQS